MIITKHGDIMLFVCDACGCRFHEAASKTHIGSAAVWDPDKNDHGTYMDCPDCGNPVLGFREQEKKNEL